MSHTNQTQFVRFEHVPYGKVVDIIHKLGWYTVQVSGGAPFVKEIYNEFNDYMGYMLVFPWSNGKWTATVEVRKGTTLAYELKKIKDCWDRI